MTGVENLSRQIQSSRQKGEKVIQLFKPSILRYWFLFPIASISLIFSFLVFGLNTVAGLSILSVTGIVVMYTLTSVYTTKYLLTPREILIKKGPFSKNFKEINYFDIESILIDQGAIQKRFKIGDMVITTKRFSKEFKGIKKPHQIRECINKAKTSAYESRTFMRKIL